MIIVSSNVNNQFETHDFCFETVTVTVTVIWEHSKRTYARVCCV
jgi:hypothetical protein